MFSNDFAYDEMSTKSCVFPFHPFTNFKKRVSLLKMVTQHLWFFNDLKKHGIPWNIILQLRLADPVQCTSSLARSDNKSGFPNQIFFIVVACNDARARATFF